MICSANLLQIQRLGQEFCVNRIYEYHIVNTYDSMALNKR